MFTLLLRLLLPTPSSFPKYPCWYSTWRVRDIHDLAWPTS